MEKGEEDFTPLDYQPSSRKLGEPLPTIVFHQTGAWSAAPTLTN